jgi:large repetitive protein
MKTAMSVPSGRRTVGVMLLATVVALALVVALGVSANKASAATQTVTRSFSNSHLILIPEGAPGATVGAALPYPSTIMASFPAGTKVKDVNVTLRNYSHTYPDDVDVLLVHKGVNRTIMSDVGGSIDVNNQTFQLDDEAANGHLPDGGPLQGGAFQPTNAEGGDTFDFPAPSPASANSALSGFDGLLTKGGWKLFVDDNGNDDVGRFGGGWTIKIRAAVPQ